MSDLIAASENAVTWSPTAPAPPTEPQPSRTGRWRRSRERRVIRPAVPELHTAAVFTAARDEGKTAGGRVDQHAQPDGPATVSRAQAAAEVSIATMGAALGHKAFTALGDLEARMRAVTADAVIGATSLVSSTLLVAMITVAVFADVWAFQPIASEIFNITPAGKNAALWQVALPYLASLALSLALLLIGVALALGLEGLVSGRDTFARRAMTVLVILTAVGVALSLYGLVAQRSSQAERSTDVGQATAQAVTAQAQDGHLLMIAGLALATIAAATLLKFTTAYPGMLTTLPDSALHRRQMREAHEHVRGAVVALVGAVEAALAHLASPALSTGLAQTWLDGYQHDAHPSAIDRVADALTLPAAISGAPQQITWRGDFDTRATTLLDLLPAPQELPVDPTDKNIPDGPPAARGQIEEDDS